MGYFFLIFAIVINFVIFSDNYSSYRIFILNIALFILVFPELYKEKEKEEKEREATEKDKKKKRLYIDPITKKNV